MKSMKNVCLILLGVLGVLMLVTGCILIYVFSTLIHKEIEDNVPLRKGSQSFKEWSAPTSPIYFQVWMFDVVNHEEVVQGEKPVLEQKGPYTYREYKEKVDVIFNPNGTLNYREISTYVFEPDLSIGYENDTFVTVDLPYLTLASMTRWNRSFIKEGIDFIFSANGDSLFRRISVGDLMWGYKVQSFVELNKIFKLLLNITLPEMFGLFYGKNNTDNGLFEIHSGDHSLSNFGEIISWNVERDLNFWTTNISNMINGSDGTIYPPFVNTADTKYIFSPDICRSIALIYDTSVDVRGIELKRFVAPDFIFANITVNPSNKGFCTPSGHCLPSGLLNVSICRQGAPVIMSNPHFLGCDESVQNGVRGLSPNREEHESYIEVEPMTGVAMNVGKKLQINTYIERIAGYKSTTSVTPAFVPILWLNESAKISASDAADFKSQVLDKVRLTKIVQYSLIGVGLFILVVLIVVIARRKISWFVPKSSAINADDNEPILIPASVAT